MIQLHMPFSDDYDNPILNQLTVTKLLDTLEGEHLDIIQLWMSGSYTLQEIGQIVGEKYHGNPLQPSVIRYHRDKILRRLRVKFNR